MFADRYGLAASLDTGPSVRECGDRFSMFFWTCFQVFSSLLKCFSPVFLGFVEVLDGPALDAAPLGRGRHLRPGRRGDHPHRVKSP